MTGTGALVTGAGSGIGRAVAEMLASRGHRVHVTDVDLDAAERAAEQIGLGAFASALDVRDADASHAAARATVERTGSLEVWVNNAGVLLTGPAWEQTPEQHRLMFDVNALGTVNGTLAALGPMRAAGRGHVVNIVSLAGLVAASGEGVYSASKHAALAFSLSTAADLRVAGIRDVRISCICPDGVWTPMLHDKLDDPEAALSFSGVLLQPEDVVLAVARTLDRPRPVRSIPGWRGGQARFFAVLPRLMLAGIPTVRRIARLQQRLHARRIRRERQR